jgi:AAA family ATP:ADP antiporter
MSSLEMRQKTSLERLLSVITVIEPGEGVTALLMSLNIFLLLSAYYVLKSLREAFVSTEGANTSTAVMALLLIPMVKAYGAVAVRVPRKKLISYVTAFFIANLLILYFLAEIGFRYIGVVFFVWVGIFNNMVIAQFWAFGNDLYRPEQGKRLFPLIMLGASVGAIFGPLLAPPLGEFLGTNPLLLFSGGMLAVCIAITILIDNREMVSSPKATQKHEVVGTMGRQGGFELVWKHRYLFLIAFLIVLLNIVNTTGEQIRRATFNEHAQASVLENNPSLAGSQLDDAIETAKLRLNADFFFWVNLLTVLIQALLVSRILRLLGVRGAILMVPLVVFLGYGMMALLPLLWVVRAVKIVENSQDYSLMNTLRAALYLPTTREMKYKAKQAIDTFFVRFGDLVAAGTWYVGVHWLALTIPGIARLMLMVVAFWVILAILIAREHRKLVPDERLSSEAKAAVATAG